MSSVTRVRLAVVLLILAGACLTYAAPGGELVYVAGPTDQDFGARGYAKEVSVQKDRFGTVGDVIVSCTGLTPGAKYHVEVFGQDAWGGRSSQGAAGFVATTRGQGKVTIRQVRCDMGPVVLVNRAGDVPVRVFQLW